MLNTNQIIFAEEKVITAKSAVIKAQQKKEKAEGNLERESSKLKISAELRLADANVSLSDAKVDLAEAKLHLTEAKLREEKYGEVHEFLTSQLLDEHERYRKAYEQAQEIHQVNIKALSNMHELAKAERTQTLSSRNEIRADPSRLFQFSLVSSSFGSSFFHSEGGSHEQAAISCQHFSGGSGEQKGSFQRPCQAPPPGKDQEFVWGLVDRIFGAAHKHSSLVFNGLFASQKDTADYPRDAGDNVKRLTLSQPAVKHDQVDGDAGHTGSGQRCAEAEWEATTVC